MLLNLDSQRAQDVVALTFLHENGPPGQPHSL